LADYAGGGEALKMLCRVTENSSPEGTVERFSILDALRGVLALIVVLGHVGMPPLFGPIDQDNEVWRALARMWRTLAFGPPAVIAFFVISGFCIHYPFAKADAKLPVIRFYLRRYLRIGLPIVAVAIILFRIQPTVTLLGEKSVFWQSTLWSVLCEEVYYAFYPLILIAIRHFGLGPLIVSGLSSLAVITRTFPVVEWSEIGVISTSIVLLPVWLLGAYLAKWARSTRLARKEIAGFSVGWWRAGAWALMWLALIFHFHSFLHQTVTGIIVGIYVYLWLRVELQISTTPGPFLLWFGTWSYSLYLIHPLVISSAFRNGFDVSTSLVDWGLTMVSIFGFSYLFFLLIEAPSHALARRVSLRLSEG
jgi:peptidoglycan/LPS O-acetylase OafA/YrhL